MLNLANNNEQEWTYSADNDAWTLSIVSAVAYPEIEDEEGVSVCVPGTYVTDIDTDSDGEADVTADNATDAVNGSLVIDYDAEITSTNNRVYTADTAPVIINTGAAGYASSTNTTASAIYAADGYVNVACGNRDKQDTVTDDDGNTVYTGDAPSCLADQKAAARFVRYNIVLGNLPGSTEYFVSTGGSGGGAHAVMFAATSDNSDFYDYQIEVGAVGVYKNNDGTYSTEISCKSSDGLTELYEISDGAWGCVAYSAITSLYEADMTLAFECYMDTTYEFSSSFQEQLAEYLSEAYMEYINDKHLSVSESDVELDINGDGDTQDTIDLSIEYDADAYPETNGYYGTYLDFYLAEFVSNLQWYLDNLDCADGWTWFDSDGNALLDDEVSSMTTQDKAQAFIEGRYTKGSETSASGDLPSGMKGRADFTDGEAPDGASGELPDGAGGELPDRGGSDNSDSTGTEGSGDEMEVSTPDSGSTQSASGSTDSENYESYSDMLEAYQTDIASVLEGDEYGNNGNNIVSLYNPLNYIDADDTENPTWTRILMGASEGDLSMFNSLNLQIAWLAAGTDCNIEWQWDGGHVPSEILGESLSFYVDEMYAKYVDGAVGVSKSEAQTQVKTAQPKKQRERI